MRLFIIFAFLVLVNEAVASESLPKLHKSGWNSYMGAYDPPAPTNWLSIPEPARSRIIAHLKNRLGDDFYAELSLVGGQIIDFKTLREKEPNSKDYEWEVPAYHLVLRFSRPEIGIEYYEACVDCWSDGAIIHEIDLPEIAKHPDRAQFISTTKAVEIAGQRGFDHSKMTMEIAYQEDLGVCIYRFRQLTRHEGVRLFYKCIDIDAHCGTVAKLYHSEAIE